MVESPKPKLPTINELDEEMIQSNRRLDDVVEALEADPALLAAYQLGLARAQLSWNHTEAIKALATNTSEKTRADTILLVRAGEEEVDRLATALDGWLQDRAKAQA